MIDLTPVTAFLSSLGPWGVLAGAALAVLAPRLKPLLARLKALAPAAPAVPPPPPDATPTPAGPATPLLSGLKNRPVLNALLQVLLSRIAQPQAFGSVGGDEGLEDKLTSLLVEHLKTPPAAPPAK